MNKDNMVNVAIWVGHSKPPMKAFFKPLIQLFNELGKSGVTLKTPLGNINFKFQPLFGIFDLIAKALILNMNQFNGVNGCPTCLHPGVHHGSRYYLPDNNTYALRTNESVKEAAKRAENDKCVVSGIKGVSILTEVVDLVDGVPIDYMHCVLEGVAKWLTEKWFSSVNHNSAWYIGTNIKAVDMVLLGQRPPHDFSRAPRSLEKHRKYWKASEFRNWLLYYSLPILKSILPPLYWHHYALLVCAMHILLQSELTEIKIEAAEQMLKDYYILLPELYGLKSCTLNAHCLTHLTTFVRLWGPLWTHSLFGFESMNGHITSMVHSKYKVAEQLSFSVDVCHTIGELADHLSQVENQHTLDFIAPLSSTISHKRNMIMITPGIYSIGNLKSACFSREEVGAIQKLTSIPSTVIKTFHKLYIHGTTLYSGGKRDSSICCYNSDGTKNYGTIDKFCFSPPLVILKPFKKASSSLLNSVGNPCRANLRQYADIDLLSAFFIQVSNDYLPIRAVPISSLSCKCVRISCNHSPHSYIVHIPNNYEHH